MDLRIYYDNPSALHDQNSLRASFGILVKTGKQEIIDKFFTNEIKDIKKIILPICDSIYAKQPIVDSDSISEGKKRIYPARIKKLEEVRHKYKEM